MQWSTVRYIEALVDVSPGFRNLGRWNGSMEQLLMRMSVWIAATAGPWWWPIVLGFIARLFAGTIAYPYIVVRTELQVMAAESGDAPATAGGARETAPATLDARMSTGDSTGDKKTLRKRRPKSRCSHEGDQRAAKDPAVTSAANGQDAQAPRKGDPTSALAVAASRIYKRGGIAGFWTGWQGNMLGQLPSASVQTAVRSYVREAIAQWGTAGGAGV